MILTSREIPQADRLSSVIQAIVNIGNGARTDEEIIRNMPNLNADRQGRYYRIIGELLGFVNNVGNNATLTEAGQLFVAAPTMTNPHLIDALLRMRIFQIILPFIERNQTISRPELIEYLERLHIIDVRTGRLMAYSTIERRVNSLLSWLVDLNIISRVGNQYQVQNIISPLTNTYEVQDDLPILPATGDLQEYQTIQERIQNASETVQYQIDLQKLERASNAHTRLVNLVADRIREIGSTPKYNQLIDLATRVEGSDYIFEMKSLTNDNSRSQVRNGLSQLYEYSYLQNLPNASLVLVIETHLPANTQWMINYLETNRNIQVVWDGDNNLYGTERSRELLPFLNLLP